MTATIINWSDLIFLYTVGAIAAVGFGVNWLYRRWQR